MSKTEERAASERERGLNGDGLGGDGLNADSDFDFFAEPALQDADEDEEDGAAFYADLADVQRSSAVTSTETKVAMVGYVPRKRGRGAGQPAVVLQGALEEVALELETANSYKSVPLEVEPG